MAQAKGYAAFYLAVTLKKAVLFGLSYVLRA